MVAQNENILIIENDENDRLALEYLFKQEKIIYNYTIVRSIGEATKLITNNKFDVIIADYRLDENTAFDLFEIVDNVPIIIMTGQGNESLAVQAMKLGAYDYLIKDIASSYLEKLPYTIKNVLKRKKSEDELKRIQDHLKDLVEERTREIQDQKVQIEKLNDILAAMNSISHLIVKCTRRSDLISGVCDHLMQTKIFNSAWIILFDQNGKVIKYAHSGKNLDFGLFIEQLFNEQKNFPCMQALSNQEVITIKKSKETCKNCSIFSSFPFDDALSMRLKYRRKVFGLLVVSINRTGVRIDSEVIRLFETIACDIAFALHNIIQNEKRRKAEAALKESEAKYRALYESSHDGWVRADLNGNFQEFNNTFVKLLGYTEPELKNLSYRSITPAKWYKWEREKIFKEQLLRNGFTEVYEKELIKKNGVAFPVEIRGNLIVEDDKPVGMWGFIRDISKRKKTERRLIELNKKLKFSNKELEEFSYVVSHDLKEPLKIISSYLKFIKEDYTPVLKGEGLTYLERVLYTSDRMISLIDSLLELAQIGRNKMNIQQINSYDYLIETLKLLQFNERISDNEFSEIYLNDFGDLVKLGNIESIQADPVQFSQLMQNLLTNCLKYRKPQMSIEVVIDSYMDKDSVVIFIRDNGRGIPAEYQNKIFEVFNRVPLDDSIYGMGIGLAICKKIMDQHGGKIWYESEIGMGSTFYITFKKGHLKC